MAHAALTLTLTLALNHLATSDSQHIVWSNVFNQQQRNGLQTFDKCATDYL